MKKDFSNIELIKGKRSRKRLKVGDVFTLQISEDSFLLGHVTHVDIESYDSAIDICALIYSEILSKKDLEDSISFEKRKLLYERPLLLNSTFWRSGMFTVIGNTPLSSEEENMNFVFYSLMKHSMVDVSGNKIETNEIFEDNHDYAYGLYNPHSIVRKVKRDLILNQIFAEIEKYEEGVHELNLPLTKEEILEFETKYSFKLPTYYKEFLRKTNGCEIFSPGTSIAGVSLDKSFKRGFLYLEYSFNGNFDDLPFLNKYIVIGSTNYGDLILLNKRNYTIHNFCHETGDICFLKHNFFEWFVEEFNSEAKEIGYNGEYK